MIKTLKVNSLRLLLLFIVIINYNVVFCKNRSGDGIYPHGTMRMFIVFVNFSNDTTTNTPLPENLFFRNETTNIPDLKWCNHEIPSDTNNLRGLTKYLYDASFGRFVVLGDYYPTVIQMDTTGKLKNFNYMNVLSEVADMMVSSNGRDIISAHGFSVKNNDFDLIGSENSDPDSFVDLLVIVDCTGNIYRGGGFGFQTRNFEKTDFKFFNIIIQSAGIATLKHEFAHFIIGGNEYHIAGKNASCCGYFIYPTNGYGLLSGADSYSLFSSNEWDRWATGWFPHAYNSDSIEFRACNTAYETICSDFHYGDSIGQNSYYQEFILRDYMKYGDVIRIKIPTNDSVLSSKGHPYRTAEDQWIWISNRQMTDYYKEYRQTQIVRKPPTGIYINYQIGVPSNNLQSSSSIPYFWYPICRTGNYDFTYSFDKKKKYTTFISTKEDANPLTGYNYQNNHAYDHNKDGKMMIYKGDMLCPGEMMIDTKNYTKDNFFISNVGLASVGASDDAFRVGDSLGIGTNPSTSALYAIQKKNRKRTYYIYPNGLQIKVLDTLKRTGENSFDIKVAVSWNNFEINNDVRWCGPIAIKEKLIINNGKTLLLDLGKSPYKLDAIVVDEDTVFVEKTELRIRTNAYFEMRNNAHLNIKKHSRLTLDSASNMILGEKASILVNENCTIQLAPHSKIDIRKDACIYLDKNAILSVSELCKISIDDGIKIKAVEGAIINIPESLKPFFRIKWIKNFNKKEIAHFMRQ